MQLFTKVAKGQPYKLEHNDRILSSESVQEISASFVHAVQTQYNYRLAVISCECLHHGVLVGFHGLLCAIGQLGLAGLVALLFVSLFLLCSIM